MSSTEGVFEIQNLVNRYSDAVNRRDWKTYQECWVKDGVWDLGAPVNQKKVGIEEVMKEVQRAVGGMSLFVQMPHAIYISEINGDSARGTVTLNEVGRIKPESKGILGDAEGMNILATYHDLFKREMDGEWKFAVRKYEVLLFLGKPPEGEIITMRD